MSENRCTLTVNENGVVHLRLTRPDARNAIDLAMVEALADAIDTVATLDTARSLLISGEGPSFCVGGDLNYFTERLESLSDEFTRLISLWHRALSVLAALPFPVVTAVHGGTAGGGLGLVWCADHVIAAESTKIATGFTDLGLSGDGGSSWHLPRLIGLRRAQELLLDNRVLDAETALAWGLVNRVVPDGDLLDCAIDQAHRYCVHSITATRQIKRLLAASTHTSYTEHLATEVEAMIECSTSSDARIGISSFVERRPASFTDR